MSRADLGTSNYFSNKIKSKGFHEPGCYCQMCKEQYRDENSYFYTMSGTHPLQLLLFANPPVNYIYSFSEEFSNGFMELLRRRFGNNRVNASKVYQEYIAAKDHIEINATRWLTLSDYIKWLGRTGQVVADKTDKGWYITCKYRSSKAEERQAMVEETSRMEMDEEKRMREFKEEQIENVATRHREQSAELRRENDHPVRLETRSERNRVVGSRSTSRSVVEPQIKRARRVEEGEVSSSNNMPISVYKQPRLHAKVDAPSTSRDGALIEILEERERKKELYNRRDYWLHPRIIVKFVDKSLGPEYYKQKAVVRELVGKYSAIIKFIRSGKKLKAEQCHLETIIPNLKHYVLVVNGAYRGQEAILCEVNEKKGTATIELVRGPYKGRIVKGISFDDICKLQ